MRVGRIGNQVRVTVNTDGDAEFEVDLARTYTTLGTGTGVGIGIYGGATADNFASSNPVATTTTVSSSDNPSIEGDPVTFTAVVAADTGTPTGSIVFTVDGTAGAPIPMSGGQASLSTSVLTDGDHTISAAYTSNDAEVADSASSDLTQTVEPAPRPDARIRRANRPLVGEDVYNTTGAGQTSSGNGRARQTLVFTISVQNDGEVTESILLHGQGSTNRFGVTYRDATGVNITRQVIDGTYRLRQVTPGSARRVTASVLIRPATTPGQTLSRLVTTTSVRSHAFTDVVRFVTRRSP
jgi:hypothetical protein